MSALDATTRLTTLLDELAAALAAPDADAMLALEGRLVPVLAELATPGVVAADDRPRLTEALARARGSVARCAVLGASLADGARLALSAQGLAGQYGPSGVEASPARSSGRGQRLHARV